MECHFTTSDSKRSVPLGHDLADIHRQVDIELATRLLRFGNLIVQGIKIDNVVDGRSATRSQEPVVHFLADHDVVDADL